MSDRVKAFRVTPADTGEYDSLILPIEVSSKHMRRPVFTCAMRSLEAAIDGDWSEQDWRWEFELIIERGTIAAEDVDRLDHGLPVHSFEPEPEQ